MGQQPQICGKFAGRLCNPRQGVQDEHIHLSGIGLSRHRYTAGKSHLAGDFLFQRLYFFVVSLKQFQERCLGSRSALASQQLKVFDPVFHLMEVQKQFIHPQGGAFAYRGQLSCLKVGKAQGGYRFIGVGKLSQIVQYTDQLVPNER